MAKKEIKTQTIVADHVEHLRSIRAEEKRAQQRILNITAAKEAYLADPNQETLADNLRCPVMSLLSNGNSSKRV